jgi:hypothetical protein
LYLEFSDFPKEAEGYLKKVCNYFREGKRKSYENIPDPLDTRKKLINYDTIPKSTIEKYGIPSKEELIRTISLHTLAREVQVHKKDLEYYMSNKSTLDLAHEYSRIAAWLRYGAAMRHTEAVSKGFADKNHLYTTMIRLMAQEAETLGWKSWSVENIQVFKRRLKPFVQYEKGKGKIEEALDSLVYKRIGMVNAQKVNEYFENVVLWLYGNKNTGIKLLPDQVYILYEQVRNGQKMLVDTDTGEVLQAPLDKNGEPQTLPKVCIRTIQNFLNLPKIQLIATALRDGNKYLNDKFAPYIWRMKPKYSGSMTSSDGAVIPLRLIINNKLTWKRALAYMIFDVKSECIIGVSYGLEEDLKVMNEAFKNMLLWTDGYVPLENQLDNFGRGNKEKLQKIFKYVSFCEPYNPQSKYAERLIGHFEGTQLRMIKGWQGTNNQSKKQSGKKNPDIEDIGYTLKEVIELHQNAIKNWNMTVPKWCKSGKTRLELWNENKNPEALQLQDRELARLAGKSKIGNIVRGFVKVEYGEVEYDYMVENYAELTSELSNGWSVRVVFLPHKMDRVWLYNYKDKNDPQEDTYLCECKKIVKTQAAKAERTEADNEALANLISNKQRFNRWMMEEIAKIPEITTVDVLPTTYEEAELVISAGYTDKPLMQAAEELLNKQLLSQKSGKSQRQLKPDRLEAKRDTKERIERSKKLKEMLYETEVKPNQELVEVQKESNRELLQRLRYEI